MRGGPQWVLQSYKIDGLLDSFIENTWWHQTNAPPEHRLRPEVKQYWAHNKNTKVTALETYKRTPLTASEQKPNYVMDLQ
jgi:hypothetical protein